MSPRKRDTADQVRLEMVRLLDRIHNMMASPSKEHPPAPRKAAGPKSRAYDGWKVRKFTTTRRRVPAAMTPRLRSVLQFMIDAKKPVTDATISKELKMSIAATRTALYHLRKNGFADMLSE